MSLSLRAGRAALAEDMGMTLLPRAHPIMALCSELCDERGGGRCVVMFCFCLMSSDAKSILGTMCGDDPAHNF